MIKITVPSRDGQPPIQIEGSCAADFLAVFDKETWDAMRGQIRSAATAPQANTTTPAATNGANAGQTVAQAMREMLPAIVDAVRASARGDDRVEQHDARDGAIYERTADGRYVPVPRERPTQRMPSSNGRISRCVPERLRAGTPYLSVASYEDHEASAVTLSEALRHEDVASSSSPWIAAGVATIAGGLLGAWLSSE